MLVESDLYEIKGGAKKWMYIGVGVGAVITFLIGLVDGYLRPLKCN